MLLVDTSIWIDHFRKGDAELSAALERDEVLIHAFVVGELALGHKVVFESVASELSDLPQATIAVPDEVLRLISRAELGGSGIGYVDAHLVASTLLTPESRLWTRDKRLKAVADRLSISA
ncbi:type II toxin-antitoxin system VapC family toxin [Rhodopseudomonas palustris]|uniref:Type II toxin-antitoxin system VapC family toxin n=1 Tax=Rhodopseudomonas palustris TaxID=1076 RepID=A0A418UYU0_RHOPL|nr:PIN domain-containing protein [Rhodopseudomonas palustris]RJF68419.1 type II toxin-antitoxin system VapC family toxin [Rhodopseudomonas palustris]